MVRITAVVVMVLACTACGGGGTAGPSSALGVVSFTPGVVYAFETSDFFVTGNGFAPLNGTVQIVLTATGGITPFLDGTTDRLELTAQIQSGTTLRGTLPPTRVTQSTAATLTIIQPDGESFTTSGPVLTAEPQFLTGFTPSNLDGSDAQAFTVDGVNLRPQGGQVQVAFRALVGSPFHIGSGRAREITSQGRIDQSGTSVTGITSYAGVLAATPVEVRVTLPGGGVLTAPAATTTFNPGAAYVQGRWTYERAESTITGLDYGDITEHPIRGAKIQLIRDGTGTVITTRTLSTTGDYFIDYAGLDQVRMRVLAETGFDEPPIRVQDNTDENATWSVETAPFPIGGGQLTQDYVAASGWGGAAYTGPRASAPFAILDACYGAAQDFLAVRDVSFNLCTLNWSPDNRPEDGDVALGQIGTSHFDAITDQLFILGKEDVDTDEFDLHVVVHEWGHWFEETISRSDSIGGAHASGERLDPRLAWSEGFATALSAIVLHPDHVYSDSYGAQQASGFGEDIEDNTTDNVNPGWFGEGSIQWLVYDLWDANSDGAWDDIALGLGPIYDALAGDVRNTPALTTIFAFIHSLKTNNTSQASAIDDLCAHHSIDPVRDEWGTAETNAGSTGLGLPVYSLLQVNGADAVRTLNGNYAYNTLENNRFFYFTGNGSPLNVEAETTEPAAFIDDHDIAVWVYRNGTLVGSTDVFYWGTETVALSTTVSGASYVIEVGNLGFLPANYTCTVRVKSP